jgi:hypothetical protein
LQHALGEWISILLKPLARAFCLVGGSERSPRCGGILGMVLLSGATRERERQQYDREPHRWRATGRHRGWFYVRDL